MHLVHVSKEIRNLPYLKGRQINKKANNGEGKGIFRGNPRELTNH